MSELLSQTKCGKNMFLKYLYVVLIPPSPPLLIRVRFDLKDIFNITINIKNIIRLYYFILLWGGLYIRGGFCPIFAEGNM
jgi:hypothetical protein